MKSAAFYLLLFLLPFVRFLTHVVSRISIVLFCIGLALLAWKGFVVGIATSIGFFLLVAVVSFLIREGHTSLLVRLQPDGIDYTFYD